MDNIGVCSETEAAIYWGITKDLLFAYAYILKWIKLLPKLFPNPVFFHLYKEFFP